MIRSMFVALVCLIGLPSLSLPREPQTPAVLYTLPADGVWVEYDCRVVDPDGKTASATLRLSAVGTVEERGERQRWIEMELRMGPKESAARKLRKLLISEKALRETGSLQASIVEALARDDSRKSVRRLSGEALDDLVGLGMRDRRTTLRTLKDKAECDTPLGKYSARHVTAEKKRAAETLVYEGWLTSDVPFGWARFHIVERREQGGEVTLFSAIACRTGTNARGRLDVDSER